MSRGGRGSKQEKSLSAIGRYCRPPHGGVDRNYKIHLGTPDSPCRPRAGAWIETVVLGFAPSRVASPPCGAWIETAPALQTTKARTRRPRAGAWIETPSSCSRRACAQVAPCGGVDRNDFQNVNHEWYIESPPVRRRGSKPQEVCGTTIMDVSPPVRGVDRNFELREKVDA